VLYHFEIELADIDRGNYVTLDFRIVQHPSEVIQYMLSRVFAYALSYQENLEFSPSGLSDPDMPALLAKDPMGSLELWVEIGNPSAKRLHKAGKVAKKVIVYTYKSAEILVKEILENDVHRSDEIQVFALDAKFLQSLETHLKKNNRWSLMLQQGQLDVNIAGQTYSTEVRHLPVVS
jgi:uncharacterized protein YaeQ